jgi:hypothetical protein
MPNRMGGPPPSAPRPSRAVPLALLLATLLGLAWSPECDAAKLAKLFPELAHRKSSLDSLALLVDAVVIEDVFGNVENVQLEASRDYADRSLELFGRELARRHYSIRQRARVSLGALVDPARPFRCSDKVVPPHTDATGFYVAASADSSERFAPFSRDTTVLVDNDALAGWRSLLAASRRPIRADSIPTLPAAIELGARLECDAIVVVGFSSWSEGLGKWATKATGLALATGSVMGAAFWTPEKGGVSISLAIFDARDGRMLWADVRPLERLAPENLKFRVPEMLADLP